MWLEATVSSHAAIYKTDLVNINQNVDDHIWVEFRSQTLIELVQ
jgi:hypothetical protein